MDERLSIAIHEAQRGLSTLKSYLRHYIYDYPLDADARKRIQELEFKDQPPLFWVKDSLVHEPASSLGSRLEGAEDDVVKGFLLLYCVSSGIRLLKEKIIDNIDECLRPKYESPFGCYDFCLDEIHDNLLPLVQGIYDVDAFVQRMHFHESYEERTISECAVLLSLTAGYVSIHGQDAVPDELRDRGLDGLLVLSTASYLSILSGKDYYDSLDLLLRKIYPLKTEYLDFLAMARNNAAKKKLNEERDLILSKLSSVEESLRQKDTAGEIIAKSYGHVLKQSDVDARIQKCNQPKNRELLYRLEALSGSQLSFLDAIKDTTLTEPIIKELQKEYHVVLASEETTAIVTVEDLVDTIILHLDFIDHFKDAALHDKPFGEFHDNEKYCLSVKIDEVERFFGMGIDRSSIHAIEDLRKFVSNNNHLLKRIVSLIVEKLDVSPDDISFDSNIWSDLGADSLDTIELIMEAEQIYGIKIPDEKESRISTVGDIYNTVLEIVRDRDDFSLLWEPSE